LGKTLFRGKTEILKIGVPPAKKEKQQLPSPRNETAPHPLENWISCVKGKGRETVKGGVK